MPEEGVNKFFKETGMKKGDKVTRKTSYTPRNTSVLVTRQCYIDYRALPDRYFHLAIKAYEKEDISLGKLVELLKPLKEFKRTEIIDLLQELDIEVRIGPGDEDEILEEFENA